MGDAIVFTKKSQCLIDFVALFFRKAFHKIDEVALIKSNLPNHTANIVKVVLSYKFSYQKSREIYVCRSHHTSNSFCAARLSERKSS